MPEPTVPKNKEENLYYFQKIWRFRHYLNVEPFIITTLLATTLNSIAIQYFPISKACHVNLGYSNELCEVIFSKTKYNIDCDLYDFENITEFIASKRDYIQDFSSSSEELKYSACKAEVGAQKLLANVNGKSTPIASIFTLIVLLFAGGWSDRYNKRKTFMLIPIMAECSAIVFLLISAIYFDEIPMEFGAYAWAIIPSIFGGSNLLFMAIESYMALTTPQEDRIYRFGIFNMCFMTTPIIAQPVSGLLFQHLGYIMSFALALILNITALLIIIFSIKEVTSLSQPAEDLTNSNISEKNSDFKPIPGVENHAFEISNNNEISNTKENSSSVKSENGSVPVSPQNTNCLANFFDTTLAINCLKQPLKKRPNHGRFVLLCLILANTLAVVPIANEAAYVAPFTIKKLNWSANDNSIYNTIYALLSVAGTFIATTIFSKLLKFSDALVALLSSITTVFAKLLFGFANNTATFYAGATVDMFFCATLIAIKTISTNLVPNEELGQILSIFGIIQQIGLFILSPIYSYVYENTVNYFAGAIYLLSEVFSVPNVIIFIIFYILIKRGKILTNKSDDMKDNLGQKKMSYNNDSMEITRL